MNTALRRTLLRRLSRQEIDFYASTPRLRRECSGFPRLAPLGQGVTGLIVYAHRYAVTANLDALSWCVVCAYIERMQTDHREPLSPRRNTDDLQLLLFQGLPRDAEMLSSRSLLNAIADKTGWSDGRIADGLDIHPDALDSVRRGSLLSLPARQKLVTMYEALAPNMTTIQ